MSGAVFLKLEDIDGEATDTDHEGEIDIMNWSWGMMQSGAAAGQAAGRVDVQDLSVAKYMDKSSATLMINCCKGKIIPEGTLTVQRAGEDKVLALQIVMKDILISAYQPSGSGQFGDEIPVENLVLSFKEFAFKYTPQLADGSADSVIEQGWDIDGNAPV